MSLLDFYAKKKKIPNAINQTKNSIISQIIEIKSIRNRLFHYEPIWHNQNIKNSSDAIFEIQKKYRKIIDTIYWISDDVYKFLIEQERKNNIVRRFNILSGNLKKLSNVTMEEN